jgi:hypothetical protein
MQRELGSVLQIEELPPPRLVALVKSLLGKGGMTDFQVRQWGIRRTRKSVVPLKQQAVERRIVSPSSR